MARQAQIEMLRHHRDRSVDGRSRRAATGAQVVRSGAALARADSIQRDQGSSGDLGTARDVVC